MGSVNNKGRQFGAHHNPPLCTRTHQIGALLLVCTTFFLTRAFDRLLAPSAHNLLNGRARQSHYAVESNDDGSVSWPERGYGSHLSLKIYVYEENEIQGLKALMYGRDGKITAAACLKGQWGTQVILFSNSIIWLIQFQVLKLFILPLLRLLCLAAAYCSYTWPFSSYECVYRLDFDFLFLLVRERWEMKNSGSLSCTYYLGSSLFNIMM